MAPSYPHPEILGGPASKKIFQPFRPQFGLKIREGAGGLAWIRHWKVLFPLSLSANVHSSPEKRKPGRRLLCSGSGSHFSRSERRPYLLNDAIFPVTSLTPASV